jgi:cytochrome d ubiquinol oxidase subunit II
MISLAEAVAAITLASLALYALTGGADFGGGVWDLLAAGPRADDQRRLVEQAIAPIWEANHVWLILVVVLLFSAFPAAYATASVALHVPLVAMLLGIVLRGSAFVFRQYGLLSPAAKRRWGLVFAISSLLTPLTLGITIGAVTAGGIEVQDGVSLTGWVRPWLGAFQISVGLFALALFAFLAAVYLTTETDQPALQADFRLRALLAGGCVAATALASGLTMPETAAHVRHALVHSWWSWPLQGATGLAALGAFAALYRRRYRLARLCAMAQVALIVGGWGLAQRPYLIAPSLTIDGAAAPRPTLLALAIAVALGALALLPSLWWSLRVFKRAPR